MRSASLWLEMVIFAMCLILGANTMISFIEVVSQPMLSYTSEKTGIDTDDIVSWADNTNHNSNFRTGKDLILALVNTDDYACYPNAIMIDNSPIFEINKAFQTTKYTKLAELWDPSGSYKLGSTAKLNGTIKACRLEDEYERDASGNVVYITNSMGVSTPKVKRQFLHYYIEMNPPT